MLKINGVKLLVFTLVDYDAKFLMEYDKFQHFFFVFFSVSFACFFFSFSCFIIFSFLIYENLFWL